MKSKLNVSNFFQITQKRMEITHVDDSYDAENKEMIDATVKISLFMVFDVVQN